MYIPFLNMRIIDILLPLHLIKGFVLKPIARSILRGENLVEKHKLQDCYRENADLRLAAAKLSGQNQVLDKRLRRIKYMVEKSESHRGELLLTKYGEIVSIIYGTEKLAGNIRLLGENGNGEFFDSEMYLQKSENELKITDFKSQEKRKGYGRSLIKFVIAEAGRLGVERIYGDLSSQDEANFEWLIPFYESLGFRCIMFKESKPPIIGSMFMELNIRE